MQRSRSLPAPAGAAWLNTMVELCRNLRRISLTEFPTPLEEAARLSVAIDGPRLFIKRDDVCGLCSGGNKVRVMEYAMGDALERGCDIVIGSASAQSNKLREIAAAASRLGMRAVLLLQDDPPASGSEQGNLLLFHLLGADVRYLGSRCSGARVLEAQQSLQEQLEGDGHTVAVMDRRLSYGAAATAAYVTAAEELVNQFGGQVLEPDLIYITVGAGMTLAGLVLGFKHLGCRSRVVGVCAESKAEELVEPIIDYAQRAAGLIGLSTAVERDDFDLVDDHVKSGYGVVTAPIAETIGLVARQHGMVLDPVYNGKTMLTLIEHVRMGKITSEQTVVYMNTGGTPALFAHNAELMALDVGTTSGYLSSKRS